MHRGRDRWEARLAARGQRLQRRVRRQRALQRGLAARQRVRVGHALALQPDGRLRVRLREQLLRRRQVPGLSLSMLTMRSRCSQAAVCAYDCKNSSCTTNRLTTGPSSMAIWYGQSAHLHSAGMLLWLT